MTKRVLCWNYLRLYRQVERLQLRQDVHDPGVGQIAVAIQNAILDLVEPVDQPVDHFAGVGKMMEKVREEYKREATLKALNLEADK